MVSSMAGLAGISDSKSLFKHPVRSRVENAGDSRVLSLEN
jgi:hypothetical protein